VLRVLYAAILFFAVDELRRAFGFGWAQSRTPIQQAAAFAAEFFATFSVTQLLAVLFGRAALAAASIAASENAAPLNISSSRI